MPRNYVRKTEKQSYSIETLNKALHDIRENKKKIREAGRTYGIPESTLRKQLLLGLNQVKVEPLGRRPLFHPETELQLKDYILTLCNLFYGITPKELRRLVFNYAESNEIKHNFNKDLGLAGKDWLYGFLKRNPEIKLRQPEGTSINRICAFNKEEVGLFYSNLESELKKNQFPPHRIYNQDETGITTVQKRCPKVLGPKGAKKIGAATSAERGRNITALFAANAAGQFIPPLMVYPRARMSPLLQRNGPLGAVYTCTPNGWSNEDVFLKWLNHFKDHAHPTETDPILLLLDNHSSHISLEIYEFCRKNFIHVVSLPPHTSHRLQPLDLTFFGPLKNMLYREYDFYLTSTGHTKITEYDVAELLNKAFMKVATMQNASSGFRSAGIYPFNPNKFSAEEFAASNYANNQEISVVSCESLQPQSRDCNTVEEDDRPNEGNNSESSRPIVTSGVPSGTQNPVPSTSKDTKNCFMEFSPLPKNTNTINEKKGKREKQHSEILTATPMKVKLEEVERKRKINTMKKKERDVKKAARMLNLNVENSFNKSKGKQLVRPSQSNSRCKKGRTKSKTVVDDESSEESVNEPLCQEDSDFEVNDFLDPNAVDKTSTDVCSICGDIGKDKEMWYRCVYCSGWSHAECTGWDSPKNYICDFCKFRF